MSNVQFSCSALGRLDARRTFPLHARTSVCRSLFGPVDHDELNREMKAKLREISERDQQRWNFNFETDAPLNGDYEWEESPAETSPVFYQDSVQTGRTRVVVTPVKVKPGADSGLQEPPAVDVPPGCEERLAAGPESTVPGAACPGGLNQENRADRLNSGGQTRTQVPCLRRKRSATADTNTTHITDFFVKRKKPTETKSNESSSSCHHSSPPIPVAQTPRKRIR